MYYVYLIVVGKATYLGYSANLRARLQAHKKRWGPEVRLVYYEAYAAREDALRREAALKRSGNARRWLKARAQASLQGGEK